MDVSPTRALRFNEARIIFIILRSIVPTMGNTLLYNVKGGGILGYIVLIMGNTSLYNVKGGGIPGKTFVTIFCNYLLPREERSLLIFAPIIIISLLSYNYIIT